MSKTIYYPLKVSATYIVYADGIARFWEYDWATDARGGHDTNNLPDWVREFFCENDSLQAENLRNDKDWKFQELEAVPYYPDDAYAFDPGSNNRRIRVIKTWTAKDGPKIRYEGNPFPSPESKIDAELKWSCWSAEEENWPEDWNKLRQLEEGQTLRLSVSSRKECRGGRVDVTRNGAQRWQVEGHFTEYWDELHDLADTLGQVLIDSSDWETYFGDWDCQSQPIEQLKRYLKEHYGYADGEQLEQDARRLQVNAPDAFAESIPFSYYAMDPGVDRDFDFEFEGTVEQLMTRIDQEEDALIADSNHQWQELEHMFRGGK